MSQWEYVVKELNLFSLDFQGDPEKFSAGGNTLPEEKERLKGTGLEDTISGLSDFGIQLQFHLDKLGADGWEVYHIERRDRKKAWFSNFGKEVDYRFFAKRRRSE